MIFSDDMKSVASTGIKINRQGVILFTLLGFVFLLRVVGVYQNTIFYDEAVNVTLGIEAQAGDFTQNATGGRLVHIFIRS